MDRPPRVPRVVSFGECMIELQGQAFGSMRQTFGGDTLNLAVYLARSARQRGLPLQVDYATALGDDTLSAGLIDRWSLEGLHTTLVRRLPGRLPGLYLIEVDERGERRFSYWRDQAAARAYFETPEGQSPLEREADTLDALVFSGISLAILPEPGRERLLALAQRLRRRGARVVFDNNFRPRLWPDRALARAWYARVLAVADLALMTLDDEAALQGDDDLAAAAARLRAWPGAELVIKRGAGPTLVRGPDGVEHAVPTLPVGQVVDTTAAGDSFGGGYLAARLAGLEPEAAAAAGNRLAATVVQFRGALIPLQAMPVPAGG